MKYQSTELVSRDMNYRYVPGSKSTTEVDKRWWIHTNCKVKLKVCFSKKLKLCNFKPVYQEIGYIFEPPFFATLFIHVAIGVT